MSDDILDETRRSWNLATQAHNRHKRDQSAFLRDGGSTLFPESDEAIAFATGLAHDAKIPATFLESEAQAFLDQAAPRCFDVVFMSYGALIWIADIAKLFRGIARVLAPGGRYVNLDFHPLVGCFDEDLRLSREPYFAPGHVFSGPVGDDVGASGGALAPSGFVADPRDEPAFDNPHKAHSYQHSIADQLNAMIAAELQIATVREYPYANGCRVNPALVERDGRRFTMPDGAPSLPLMLGVVAVRGA